MTVLLAVVGVAALVAGRRSGHWWLDRRAARASAEDRETDELIEWLRSD